MQAGKAGMEVEAEKEVSASEGLVVIPDSLPSRKAFLSQLSVRAR